jgi:hypothetical protein
VQIGQDVGDDAVDLLGHGPVEAAQAGLHVGQREEPLRGHDGGRERRVDIPVDDDEGRTQILEGAVEGHHDRPSSSKNTRDRASS